MKTILIASLYLVAISSPALAQVDRCPSGEHCGSSSGFETLMMFFWGGFAIYLLYQTYRIATAGSRKEKDELKGTMLSILATIVVTAVLAYAFGVVGGVIGFLTFFYFSMKAEEAHKKKYPDA